MNSVAAFFLGLSVLMAFTLVALAFLQRPLHAILVELCGVEHRARFWTRLWDAWLYLMVFFCALWTPPRPADGVAGFHDFLAMFRGGIFALLAGLGLLAFTMLVSIARYEGRLDRGARKPVSILEARAGDS